MAFALVLLAVMFGVASAAVLDYAAAIEGIDIVLLVACVAAAFGFNFLRFVVWGFVHKSYPISSSYPFTATFYPAILLLAWWRGEPVLAMQIVGCLLVAAGIVLTVMPVEGVEEAAQEVMQKNMHKDTQES